MTTPGRRGHYAGAVSAQLPRAWKRAVPLRAAPHRAPSPRPGARCSPRARHCLPALPRSPRRRFPPRADPASPIASTPNRKGLTVAAAAAARAPPPRECAATRAATQTGAPSRRQARNARPSPAICAATPSMGSLSPMRVSEKPMQRCVRGGGVGTGVARAALLPSSPPRQTPGVDHSCALARARFRNCCSALIALCMCSHAPAQARGRGQERLGWLFFTGAQAAFGR